MVEANPAVAAVPEESKGGRANLNSGSAGASAAQLPENTQITLQARFISGLKSDVSNNIFFLDDNQVVYPAGHNIVLYHLEEKS